MGLPWQAGLVVVAMRDGQPLSPAVRVDAVPGTEFGIAFMRVPAAVSGPAVGGLVAGIAAILVALFSGCIGAAASAGVLAGGAFAILALVAGSAGVGLGTVGLRQVRRGGARTTGRGMAVAGIVCGGVGILLAALAMLAAALLQATSGS